MIRLEIPARLSRRRSSLLVALAFALAFAPSGCKKEIPKPVHTEPWLAHPPASASASPDAGLPATRYVLTDQSVIHVAVSTKLGKVSGKLGKVSGELTVVLGALGQSRGQVRADLDSLSLDDGSDSAAWLARAKAALGVADAGAPGVATFDVTAFDDVSPEALEPVPARDGGTPGTRRVRATAAGNLLLNGFRELKREPLEAEFGFAGDPAVPATVVIRSRASLVISLETHQIYLREPAANSAERRHGRPPPASRDVRISLELYGRKE